MIPVSTLGESNFKAPLSRNSSVERRTVNGILLLDKPVRMTSNQALQVVKRLFNARKAGHTGSLDPLASGLLPVCFGEATKVSTFLLDADKQYRVACKLGVRTSTADAEGEVVEICEVPDLTRNQIERILRRFCGEISQTPPMYSALKHQGQRLYDLAREGIEVPREPRRIIIHTLELITHSRDTLQFNVCCSKGTYIRTLVEDMARELGSCGHVTMLRRLRVGVYDSMHGMAELQQLAGTGIIDLDSLLLPVDSAISHWPQVSLSTDAVWYFLRGQAVMAPGAPTTGWLRAYGEGRFLGLAQVLPDGRVAPRRLMNIN
jgi:tRNA pseudouridine55 synthase